MIKPENLNLKILIKMRQLIFNGIWKNSPVADTVESKRRILRRIVIPMSSMRKSQ